MYKPVSKKCQQCKKVFFRPANCSMKAWKSGYRKNCSFECGVKSKVGKFRELSNKWQNVIQYQSVHAWLRNHYGKAVQCDNKQQRVFVFPCSGKSKNFQWASRTKKYIRGRDNFYMLCVSCHKKFDLARGAVTKNNSIRECYFNSLGILQDVV